MAFFLFFFFSERILKGGDCLLFLFSPLTLHFFHLFPTLFLWMVGTLFLFCCCCCFCCPPHPHKVFAA